MRHLALCLLVLLSCRSWSQITLDTAKTEPGEPKPPGIALTLADAIRLAKVNAPQFGAALTEAGLAREDRVQARAALLPNVSYTTGAIYTEPNGTPEGVFVGANSPHVYVSQGVAHLSLSFTSVADFRRARSQEVVARARAEIALRGLVTTVVRDFYGAIVAQQKLVNTQQAAEEARGFLELSEKLEHGGEVAHSDVIKAQLQANDRQRNLQESQLAVEKAKLELAVLILPSLTRDFQLVDDLQQSPSLPPLAQVQGLAVRNNPELTSAFAAVRASQQEVAAAIGAHLPSLSINYLYGIDARQYAVRSPDGTHNLGYQVAATLDLPIFNWGATQSKVRQAQLRRDQSQVELSAAQRQALANLQLFYNEAKTAGTQIDTLRQTVELAAESLRLTTLRYQSGEATALEVVDAQNTLVLSRNNSDDGLVRYRVAIANLQSLTGNF